MALLTIMKGLPLTYNRDFQEDKEALFDTADTLHSTLEVLTGMLHTATVNTQRMEAAASDSSLLATDLADYLVGKGLPFRDAHAIVAKLCDRAQELGHPLHKLPLTEYQRLSATFGPDVFQLTAQQSAAARDVLGGTAPGQVAAALKRARQRWQEAAHG